MSELICIVGHAAGWELCVGLGNHFLPHWNLDQSLFTSQKPCLQIPSEWGFRLSLLNWVWGEHKHSVHSTGKEPWLRWFSATKPLISPSQLLSMGRLWCLFCVFRAPDIYPLLAFTLDLSIKSHHKWATVILKGQKVQCKWSPSEPFNSARDNV